MNIYTYFLLLTASLLQPAQCKTLPTFKKYAYEKAMQKFAQATLPHSITTIKIDKKASSCDGYYDILENLIVIAPEICQNLALLEGTLLHELGHANRQKILIRKLVTADSILSLVHGIIAIATIKANAPIGALFSTVAGIVNIVLLNRYILLAEEKHADTFAAKHSSSKEVLEQLYQNHKQNALVTKKQIHRHIKHLVNRNKSPIKKLKSLDFFYSLYMDTHPWENARSNFFKDNIQRQFPDNNSSARSKSLANFIHEEIFPGGKTFTRKNSCNRSKKQSYRKKYR